NPSHLRHLRPLCFPVRKIEATKSHSNPPPTPPPASKTPFPAPLRIRLFDETNPPRPSIPLHTHRRTSRSARRRRCRDGGDHHPLRLCPNESHQPVHQFLKRRRRKHADQRDVQHDAPKRDHRHSQH